METLSAPKHQVQQFFTDGDDQLKSAFVRLFGARAFFNQQQWEQYVIDNLTSFEAACSETGRDPNDPFFSSARPHENAIRKIEEIALAFNRGVILSYSDPNTEKWRVWVIWDPKISGFRLDVVSYVCTGTYAGLGSRSAFASRPLAEHFANCFMPLINESLA
jgi:hypothetical protein